MQADHPPELSHNMTVTDMLQAIVTEDDYKRWRKENGIGEKKKKKKKMPRKGLNELKSESSDLSEKNAQTDGRMSWADIIELEERDSQSDDSADQDTAWAEARRSPSPDRASLDRRQQAVPTTKAVSPAETLNSSYQNDTENKDPRTKKDVTVKAAKRPEKGTAKKPSERERETPSSTECRTPAKAVHVNDSREDDTESKDCPSRTKEDTIYILKTVTLSDTAKKTYENETTSTECTTDDGIAKLQTPVITRSQQETSEKPASLTCTSGEKDTQSVTDESNSETAQSVSTTENCQRKGTRKSGQPRLTAEQHGQLQELRRRFSSIPPLTWQRLRAVLENHPAMLDMEHDHILTYLSQQPPRVMSKAVDNLRKDCYQKMRNPWNFLQALTEAAAREYISQSGYSGAV